MIWHNAKTNPPAPLTDVLLALVNEPEAAEGFLVGSDEQYPYMLSTGHPVESGRVYAWTELPKTPAIAGISATSAASVLKTKSGGSR